MPAPTALRMLVLPMIAAVAFAAAPAAAEERVFKDPAEYRDVLIQVLDCAAPREQYEEVAGALGKLYYGKAPDPGLVGWTFKDLGFVAQYTAPQPFTFHGQQVQQVLMAGEGILAVLDGDQMATLSAEYGLEQSDAPLTSHIRIKELSRDDWEGGGGTRIQRTASTIDTLPGKTLLGCEYVFFLPEDAFSEDPVDQGDVDQGDGQ